MPIIVQSPTPTDEDAAPTTPSRSISRRMSRLEQWIDLHAHTDDEDQGDGVPQGSSPNSHPYLAYCDMRQARSASCDDDSRSIPDSFVLVDGDDGIGGSCREEPNGFEEVRGYPHVTETVLIYSLSHHRHLLSLVLAHLTARVATRLCFALRPLFVLSVSLCLPLAPPPFPPTIPPLTSTAIPPPDSRSPWAAMVAHSAMDRSLPLGYKMIQKNRHPPHLPPDPVVRGHSNGPAYWGLSRPQAQMSPSTKGPHSTCPHRGPVSHPLSLSPPEPQGRPQTHPQRI